MKNVSPLLCRVFLVAVIAHPAGPALAADWEGDATRILGDPSFLPVAGQVEGRFDYTYSASLHDVDETYPGGGSSNTHSSYDRSENAFASFLSYGLTDEISVFASLNTGNSRLHENFSYDPLPFPVIGLVRRAGPQPPLFTETFRFHSLGAGNPAFGATWRVIDQTRAPVSVDVTGSYSPDIFQARSAGLEQTGSFASGGQSGSIQVAASREMHVLTLRAYGTVQYLGRRNDLTNAGFADLRSAPHASYAAGLQSEVRLASWLAINAGVTAQQAMRYDRSDEFPGYTIPVTIKPSGSISPYVGLVVPFLPQRLVGEMLYQHDFINNEELDFPAREETRFYKQSDNLFTARVLFAFGGAPAMPPPAGMQPAAVTAPAPQEARTYLVFFDWDRADFGAGAADRDGGRAGFGSCADHADRGERVYRSFRDGGLQPTAFVAAGA